MGNIYRNTGNRMKKTDVSDSLSDGKKNCADQHIAENIFERVLWNVRYIVLLGVLFGTLSAIVLFLAGSTEIYHILVGYIRVG